MDPNNIILLVLVLPAFISSLTIHEFAHAWMAHRLGDDTARLLGRLSLDPLVHLDFIGTAMMVVAILLNWPLLGWAKPVPINPNNFENRTRGQVLVAIAGPISNLLQAVVWLILLAAVLLGLKLAGQNALGEGLSALFADSIALNSWVSPVLTAIKYGILINIALAAFNMIPLPPLDGHWVLMGLEFPSVNRAFEVIRPYSFFLLILLVALPPFSDYFDLYMMWFIGWAYHLIAWIAMLFI
jgi:Zn-dependent protease